MNRISLIMIKNNLKYKKDDKKLEKFSKKKIVKTLLISFN